MCYGYVTRQKDQPAQICKKEGCGMMSPSDEKRIVAMVDSFTKTVARNFSRNLKRAKANAEKHYSDEPVDYFLETLSHDDRYPSDYFVLYADELSCVVHSETLYNFSTNKIIGVHFCTPIISKHSLLTTNNPLLF